MDLLSHLMLQIILLSMTLKNGGLEFAIHYLEECRYADLCFGFGFGFLFIIFWF
jgi:hypothetical protein